MPRQRQRQQQQQRKEKMIRFAEDKPPVYIYDARPDDVLWFTDEDFAESRANSRAIGQQNRKDGFDELLEETFHNPRDEVQKYLKEYAKLSHSRGLERFTCRSHGEERIRSRKRAVSAVLAAQDQARQRQSSVDRTWQALREISVLYCVDARIFARRMAKADAAVVRLQENKSKRNAANGNSTRNSCQSQSAYTSRKNAGRSSSKI